MYSLFSFFLFCLKAISLDFSFVISPFSGSLRLSYSCFFFIRFFKSFNFGGLIWFGASRKTESVACGLFGVAPSELIIEEVFFGRKELLEKSH